MSIHSFYEGMVEVVLDFLTIHTEGQILRCKNELKGLLCRSRFPRCVGKKAVWGKLNETCIKAMESCPTTVQDVLRKFDLCRKIDKGEDEIESCKSFSMFQKGDKGSTIL